MSTYKLTYDSNKLQLSKSGVQVGFVALSNLLNGFTCPETNANLEKKQQEINFECQHIRLKFS